MIPRVLKPDARTRVVQLGAITIRLRLQHWRKYSAWVIRWRDATGSHREKKSRLDIAIARAEEIAIALHNGHVQALAFNEADRAAYLRCKKIAEEIGAPIETLVEEAAAARRAAREANFTPKPVPEAVAEFLDFKRAENAGRRWITDLDRILRSLARFFTGPIHVLDARTALAWINQKPRAPRTHNNLRSILLQLARFAAARNWLPPGWRNLDELPKRRAIPGEEELYTADELAALLHTAAAKYPQHLPALACLALAGLRHSELRDADAALDWSDVHLGADPPLIHVRAHVAKSRTARRYVPICDSLRAWLTPHAKPRGPVAVVANLNNALQRIARAAGVRWKRNALRNTYISSRAAITGNLDLVASECGTSVAQIHKHYRRELTAAEAARWFTIRPPETGDKIIHLTIR